MKDIKITERGWGGHFICASECRFRRNTLVEYKDKKIVVSTVGNHIRYPATEPKEIGYNRHYETMAFKCDINDTIYFDADVSKEIAFDSPCGIRITNKNKFYVDNLANEMHENVVKEIADKIKKEQGE